MLKYINMSPIEHDVLHHKAKALSETIETTNDVPHPLGHVVQHLADLVDHSLDNNSEVTQDSLVEVLLKDEEVNLALRAHFGTAFEASPIIALGDLFKMTALLTRNFVSNLAPILSGRDLVRQEVLSDELQRMSGDLTPANLNFILKTARLAVPNLVQNKDSVTQRPGETWQTDFRILEQRPEIVHDLLSLVDPSEEMMALHEYS